MSRRRLAGALALLLTAGCGGGEQAQRAEDRQTAYLNGIVQSLDDLPGVACATGGLDTGGLPEAPLGSLFVKITPEEGVPAGRQREITREAGRRVWLSPLVVSTLSVETDGTTIALGDVIEAENSFVEPGELQAAFGPQPPVATPLPTVPDPGATDC